MYAEFITTDGHRWEAKDCDDLTELLDDRLVQAAPLDQLAHSIPDDHVWVVPQTIVACWWVD